MFKRIALLAAAMAVLSGMPEAEARELKTFGCGLLGGLFGGLHSYHACGIVEKSCEPCQR